MRCDVLPGITAMSSHAARKRTTVLGASRLKNPMPFKQPETPRKRQRTEVNVPVIESQPAPSTPLFTFTQTLRKCLPQDEKGASRKGGPSTFNEDTVQGDTSGPDEELEGMFSNSHSRRKVCAAPHALF
jgi:hypothetical protein